MRPDSGLLIVCVARSGFGWKPMVREFGAA